MPERYTKKERKEEARLARIEAQRRAARAKKMRTLYTIIGLIVAGALIAWLVSQSGKKSTAATKKIATLAAAAGCTPVEEFPDEPFKDGKTHVEAGPIAYNHNPPLSGSHRGSTGNTGVYSEPFVPETQVHNLEHGQIGLQYLPTLAKPVLDALTAITKADATAVFLAPKPDLPAGTTLAISSWDHFSGCAAPTDAGKVGDFVKAYIKEFKGKSPEGLIAGQPN